MIKQCACCGKTFETASKRTNYCSLSCANKFAWLKRKTTTINKVCPVCNKPFETANKKKTYCSRSCFLKALNANKMKKSVEKLKNKRELTLGLTNFFLRVHDIVASARKTYTEKSLDTWLDEAQQCGLDYGNYRAAIETLG